MATIKEQTEKTERLKTSLDNKVTEISNELHRDDNINITRLSEVPNAIARLKAGRKKWAEGTTVPTHTISITESLGATVVCLNLSYLEFKPRIVITEFVNTMYNKSFITVQDVKYNYCYIPYQETQIFNLFYVPFFAYKWTFGLKTPTKYTEGTTIEQFFVNGERVTADFLVRNNLYPICIRNGSSTAGTEIKIKNWIAFE